DHFLGQCKALGGFHRRLGNPEKCGYWQTQGLPRPGGKPSTDNQVDATTGADFIQQYVRFKLEFTDGVAVRVENFTVVRTNLDDIAHTDFFDRRFKYQCAGVFHGVVENGCNLAANADTAAALVGHAWNVIAKKPQYRI